MCDSILSQADMSQAEMVGCLAIDSDWTDVNLSKATLWNCILSKRVTPTLLTGAFGSDTKFMMCDMEGVDLERSHMFASTFSMCDAKHSLWNSCRLEGAVFKRSNLGRSFFQRAELKSCSFDSSDLEFANFREGDLYNCDFAESDTFGLNTSDCTMQHCYGWED
tara:strand:- start:875 stop:1366 length:492 start_codon:yes stop_codon:yes gene_type:complete